MFKVLGVNTRLKIIELLKSKGSLGAKDIAEKLGLTVAAVSQHLKILKQAGLVSSERKGYWIPYSLDEKKLEDCRSVLNDVCSCGCQHAVRFVKHKLDNLELETLQNYKNELDRELTKVQKKINQIKDKMK